MSKHARDRRPYIKPVTRIELSGENFTLRWILIVLLLCVAATALVIGITSMMETQDGWTEIEVSSQKVNCSQDFQFYYELGAGEESATVENKLLSTLYSKATEDAFLIFSAFNQEEGINNVWYLNQHINETVTVDETLFKALELTVAYGNRSIFMAPINVEYNRIFASSSDPEAEGFDPARNPEVLAYVQELASYASDPEMISLQIVGENQVRLNVAEEYLAYAETEEIETFIDFSWMTNAFIVDYIADVLTEAGYTRGYLVSYDGFTRNLDARGETFYQNIFDYQNGDLYIPAVMAYSKPLSMVFLRSYPVAQEDQWHFYRYEDGSTVSIMLDPDDGMSKAATNDLLSYSYEAEGCAEMLMQMIPVFIAEELNEQLVSALKDNGIYSVWNEGTKLLHNDSELILELSEDNSAYSIVPAE